MSLSALLLLVLLSALVAPASTSAESVVVITTARIAPVFSLSVVGPAMIDFGEVELGSVYQMPAATEIVVRSNRPWEFIDSSDTVLAIGDFSMPRETFLRHEVSLPFGVDQSPGIHPVTCSYLLDLTPVEAFDLPTDVELTATFGYTAIQR